MLITREDALSSHPAGFEINAAVRDCYGVAVVVEIKKKTTVSCCESDPPALGRRSLTFQPLAT